MAMVSAYINTLSYTHTHLQIYICLQTHKHTDRMRMIRISFVINVWWKWKREAIWPSVHSFNILLIQPFHSFVFYSFQFLLSDRNDWLVAKAARFMLNKPNDFMDISYNEIFNALPPYRCLSLTPSYSTIKDMHWKRTALIMHIHFRTDLRL